MYFQKKKKAKIKYRGEEISEDLKPTVLPNGLKSIYWRKYCHILFSFLK